MKNLIKAGANNGLCTSPYAVDGIIVKRFKLIIIGVGANLSQGVHLQRESLSGLKSLRRGCFSHSDFRAIFKSEANIVFAVDRHIIHGAVPKVIAELGNRVLLLERDDELLY